MPLPLPELDDRSFQQLIEDARRQIQRSSPGWTDLSESDPGVTLLELFAFLTETMIYRLNRLPEKAYIAFLRLLGVMLQPPAAATTTLRFGRSTTSDQPVEIPRGTRVTVNRSDGGREPPVFVTTQAVTIPAGAAAVEAPACHCELVDAELAGIGSGLPGLVAQVQRPPIVAPALMAGSPSPMPAAGPAPISGNAPDAALDLLVGVEAAAGEIDDRAPVVQYEGKLYRIWREVDSFTNLGGDLFVYVVDRMEGLITFAPAVRRLLEEGTLEETPKSLAAVPPAGREIRIWYRRGGGPDGNLAANTLTVMKDTIPGIEVTNPVAATGGRAEESLENALVRGPHELHSLQRAVTASDFELVALSSSRAIARARALTRAALWTFATPGTVELLLVPFLTEEEKLADGMAAVLQSRQTEEARQQVQGALERRRPLGTSLLVNWARYKSVHVKARIVVGRETAGSTAEGLAAVRQRVLDRLYLTLHPLPTRFNATGWPFGQALRVSHIYDIALAEPGVRWVDRVRLLVDEVPQEPISAVAADAFQPHTWYAGGGPALFRTVNDGEGWEPVARFGPSAVPAGSNEQIELIAAHPRRPGLLAVATRLPNNGGSRLHISRDCGETWEAESYTTAFEVNGLAWILRDNTPVMLLATDVGLYELAWQPGASPVQILVDPARQKLALYAVAVATDVRGLVNIAVATQDTSGVYLSSEGGRPNTFRRIGLQGEDVRVLQVQYDGPRSFLWAGTAAPGGDAPGRGCFRWELRGAQDPPEGWQQFGKNWSGGSCRAIAFQGLKVLAGTHHAGVVVLDIQGGKDTWQVPGVDAGLPLRDPGRFHPVDTVATDPAGRLIMAGGLKGVFRSSDGGVKYQYVTGQEFTDKVTLPETWLFVSGVHEIDVVSEDEAR